MKKGIIMMETNTFVRGYKEQSQMDVNTINTLDASAKAFITIREILHSLKNKEE